MTAIDPDYESIDFLGSKIEKQNLDNKVTAQCISFFSFRSEPGSFELILAEGFLNVAGFETVFRKVIKLLKRGGYFVIHDEFKDHERKCDFIRENKCEIIDMVIMDETIWWNDYYRQLEAAIVETTDRDVCERFKSDMEEIRQYKQDPSPFRSIYYVLIKTE